MKCLLLLTLCLSCVILRTNASPLKYNKPKAVIASRADYVNPETETAEASKDQQKPTYQAPLVPKEQDEFERMMDFFTVGEIAVPSESTATSQQNTYDSYSPRQDDLTEPLLPPPQEQKEPNYYVVKPKKSKSKKYIPNQKLINIKNPENVEKIENEKSKQNSFQHGGEIDEEYFLDGLDLDRLMSSAWLSEADGDAEATGRARSLKETQLNMGEFIPSQQRRVDENTRRLPSEHEGARVDYQLHGHKGPDSYAFGYDTGRGKNRQFHVEERDDHGNVKGRYGYFTRSGKFRIVKYTSSPENGFRIES
ncbi:uncharacterized protein LOC129747667 isoform X2 [Uranotaenia lowii]|uniref:uncharacterized protein LOC129747667 isoform X2 n=1 Tax=Uranotaenia lowii TaxID=190385 RepID=UPI00247833F9|nr:uncharacterized protein LOC129747667 isoform X2 [Uranotaenia lowii]